MKTKKKLLRKLTGLWGQLALQPGGSHVVQACFTFAVSACSHQCQRGWSMLALSQPVCVTLCLCSVWLQLSVDRGADACWPCRSLSVRYHTVRGGQLARQPGASPLLGSCPARLPDSMLARQPCLAASASVPATRLYGRVCLALLHSLA